MKNNSPYLRAMYIVLVPIVLLIILLNSGWLQSFIAAAHINNEKYSVVEYNFYYFDTLYTFLDKDEEELASLGYDTSLTESKQQYNDEMTWRDYFIKEAEKVMAETAYFYDLAVEAGYEFSDEELESVDEKIKENYAEMTTYGLSEKNYYLSYYGSGATEKTYEKELTKKVKAEAYKAYLIKTRQISEEDIEAYAEENGSGDYLSVNVSILSLEALPDRQTGEIGESQMDALEKKYEALMERIDDGADFDELIKSFSTGLLGDENGKIENATTEDLTEEGFEFLFENQDELSAGEIYSNLRLEDGTVYVIRLDGFGENGAKRLAQEVLAAEETEAEAQEAIAGDYAVVESSFGMTLVTR
ncbi:MAG: hypothetical protein K6G40_01580 [Eubacterium sp.]|nr:hypothetical protein [Eubacterium sp.]